jgi:hypothetical protein
MNNEEKKDFKEIIDLILEYRKINRLSVDQRNKLRQLISKKLPLVTDVGDDEELIQNALFIIGDHYYELEKEFQIDTIQRQKISSIINDIDKINYPSKINHIIDQSKSRNKLMRMLVAKAIERCQERIRLAQEKNKNDQKLIIQQKKITDSLLKLIEDEDPDVRFAAIEACKKIDDPAVVHALEKSVKSEKNTFVRIAAEGTLSSMLKRRHRL